MTKFNIKTTTVSIITNKKQPITNLSANSTSKICLKPICLSLENFKNSFYAYNYFNPNKFVSISNFNYYCISNRSSFDGSGNSFDSSGNSFDSSDNSFDSSGNSFDSSGNSFDTSNQFGDIATNVVVANVNDAAAQTQGIEDGDCGCDVFVDSSGNDGSGNCFDGSGNCFDGSGNCIDGTGNCFDGNRLSLYQVTLSKFMEYNGILCENTIDPRYLIKFTNEVFKYTSFNDVPNIVMSISWGNILNWIELNKRSDRILNLNIEFHYYDENFMPGPVKYVFQYYIC